MMPGIVKSASVIAGLDEGVLPFWWIFTNGIANDRYYRQEIMHWFQGIEPHVLLWKQVRDHHAITEHFDKHILPLLQ